MGFHIPDWAGEPQCRATLVAADGYAISVDQKTAYTLGEVLRLGSNTLP
jgi:hypothetical protein